MHKLRKLRVCLGSSDGVGILEHLLWVTVSSMGLYSLYELSHSLLPPVLQGRSPELLEKWRHMEINLSNWELVFESRSVHPKACTHQDDGDSLIVVSQSMIKAVPRVRGVKLGNPFIIPF